MIEQMDGWMEGQTDRKTDRQTDRQTKAAFRLEKFVFLYPRLVHVCVSIAV